MYFEGRTNKFAEQLDMISRILPEFKTITKEKQAMGVGGHISSFLEYFKGSLRKFENSSTFYHMMAI